MRPLGRHAAGSNVALTSFCLRYCVVTRWGVKSLLNTTLAIVVIGLASTGLGMQSSPTFEVATIKPAAQPTVGMILSPGCHGWDASYGSFGTVPVGRCRFPYTTLTDLIEFAFGTGQEQFSITGAKGWMSGDRFVVEAKSEDGMKATREQLLQMLRTLIVQRFQLKFHLESKDVSGFSLVVAKGGPKWTRLDDTAPRAPGSAGRGEISGQTDPDRIARILSDHMGVPISNRTGLTDRFMVDIKWAPRPSDRDYVAPDENADRPSIFTALQEQLGLQLVPQKVAVQVFVIDSVQRPE